MDLRNELDYLFGTKETVDMRRQLLLLREKLFNFCYESCQLRVICSGSLGEGVAYPTSDDDRMFYKTDQRVEKTFEEAQQRESVLMVPSENSPGYCLLLDVTRSCPFEIIHFIDGMPFVSSNSLKHKELREGESIHGPCQSQTLGFNEYDRAHCIPCPFWPDVASEWVMRHRLLGWPSNEIIRDIVDSGCHVVPIGDQDSPFCDHEWRISFSMAERTLIHSFNHAQFLTYNLLRLALKRVISKYCPDILCSYFMKTTLFYTSEKKFMLFCQECEIETCFKACLSMLYDFVDHKYLPSYFIPEYNMIKRKVNHTNSSQILDIIRTINTKGIAGTLHFCGETGIPIRIPNYPITEWKCDLDFLNSWNLSDIDRNMTEIVELHGEVLPFNILLSRILRLLQGNSTQIISNYVFLTGIISCCQRMIHHLLSTRRINKDEYNLHKTIKALLSIGYKRDVTTGKLMAATYMYLIGKTKSALSHIRRLLSEYPLHAVDHGYDEDDVKKKTYIDVLCGRGYTIDYKIQKSWSPPYLTGVKFLNAFPMPIRLWMSLIRPNYSSFLPIPYAYFIESLCYIRQKNHSSFRKSARLLIDHTRYGIVVYWIAEIKMFVGILMKEHGDNQSACRWLESAYIMKDTLPSNLNEIFSLSALSYIACLLHKQFHIEH